MLAVATGTGKDNVNNPCVEECVDECFNHLMVILRILSLALLQPAPMAASRRSAWGKV